MPGISVISICWNELLQFLQPILNDDERHGLWALLLEDHQELVPFGRYVVRNKSTEPSRRRHLKSIKDGLFFSDLDIGLGLDIYREKLIAGEIAIKQLATVGGPYWFPTAGPRHFNFASRFHGVADELPHENFRLPFLSRHVSDQIRLG